MLELKPGPVVTVAVATESAVLWDFVCNSCKHTWTETLPLPVRKDVLLKRLKIYDCIECASADVMLYLPPAEESAS